MSQRKSVTLHQAKTHLPRLLGEVDNGVEVIIVRAGKPLVKLVPLVPAKAARKAGFLKGKIRIADDFDAPLPPDVGALFGRRR